MRAMPQPMLASPPRPSAFVLIAMLVGFAAQPAAAAELAAKFNGQFVQLYLPGRYLQYAIERADGSSAEYRLLDYSATGCTEACVYNDLGLERGTSYTYRVRAFLPDSTIFTFGPVAIDIDPRAARSLNTSVWPNPVSGVAMLHYQIPATLVGRGAVPVELSLHDVSGREMKRFVEGPRSLGSYAVRWDGRGENGELLGTGTYFYRVHAGSVTEVGRLTVLR